MTQAGDVKILPDQETRDADVQVHPVAEFQTLLEALTSPVKTESALDKLALAVTGVDIDLAEENTNKVADSAVLKNLVEYYLAYSMGCSWSLKKSGLLLEILMGMACLRDARNARKSLHYLVIRFRNVHIEAL